MSNVYISPEGEHNYNKKYEQYSIVTYTQGDIVTAYLAIKPVPPFISITDKNFWKSLNSGTDASVDISGKADKEVTPTVITPSVDGSIINLTAEEIENFRVGDIVKDNLLMPSGPMRDWLVSSIKDDKVVLVCVGEDTILSIIWTKSGNVWSYSSGGSVTYNNVAKKISIATTIPQNGMSSNTLYNLGVISQNITFLINPAQEAGIANVWTWTFSTSDTAPTITWPAQITMWSEGEAPTIEANKYYEVSVMNGVGAVISADIPQEEETEVEP